MTIEQIIEKNNQVSTLKWLERIAQSYEDAVALIEKDPAFTVTAIAYTCRSEGKVLDINPHRSLDNRIIAHALREAATRVRAEAADLKARIENE